LDKYEFYLCGNFPHYKTWDIDLRLIGYPEEKDYVAISDLMTDSMNYAFREENTLLDFSFIQEPSLHYMRDNYKKRGNDWPIVQFYDHTTVLKEGKIVTNFINTSYRDVEQMADNLWKVTTRNPTYSKARKRNYFPEPVKIN
jgi:hypothetical protein